MGMIRTGAGTALLAIWLAVASASALLAQPIAAQRGALTTAEQVVTLAIGPQSAIGVQISGTFTGTLTFEGSVDGVVWSTLQVFPVGASTPVTTATAAGAWTRSIAGLAAVRVRASSWTDGTATVVLRAATGDGGTAAASVTLEGATIEVGAQPANDPHYVRGSDGTNAVNLASETTLDAVLTEMESVDAHASRLTSSAAGLAPGGLATTALVAGGVYNATPPTFTDGQTGALQVDASGALKVSGISGSGGAAQEDNSALGDLTGMGALYDTTPPSITDGNVGMPRMDSNRYLFAVFPSAQAVTQSGTWTVQPGNTANTTAWLVTGTGGTFPATQSGSWTFNPATAASWGLFAEDSAHQSGDLGIPALFVRQDSQASLCADGDYCPATINASGELRVTVGGGTGGTALADDADFTAGTTNFTPVGGFYQSTVTACTDGDTCAAGITAQRTLKTTVYDSSGNEVPVAATGSGTINATTQRVTIATDDPVNDGVVSLASTVDTAGASAANAVAVQGATGMTPVVVDANITEVGGAAIGATAPLAVRISDGSTFLTPAEDATHDSAALTTGPQMMGECDDDTTDAVDEGDAGKVRIDCTTRHLLTKAPALETLLTTLIGSDPCRTGTKLVAHVSQTADAQIITGTASNRTYICAVNLTTATAQSIAIVSGTGTTCATSTGPLFGGTSAATGWTLANGIVVGDGSAWIAKSDTDADNICVLQSGSAQVSGSIIYVVAAN